MAEALAHGADVNATNDEDESKSSLIQAVIGVSLPHYLFTLAAAFARPPRFLVRHDANTAALLAHQQDVQSLLAAVTPSSQDTELHPPSDSDAACQISAKT